MPAIPEGYTTITPSLSFKDANKAIELYKKAFGAKELSRSVEPKSNKIMHAVLEIGNAKVFISDEFPNCPPQASSFYLYVPDVDTSVKQAKSAGLKETMPPEDMFWGDRLGSVTDEYGNSWSIATHIRDVSEDDMKKGIEEMSAKMAQKSKAA